MNKLKLGIVSMTSTDLVEVNINSIIKSLEFFKDKPTDLICFPENSLYFNFNKNLNKDHALKLDAKYWDKLKVQAHNLGCYLHLGGVPLNENGKVYNSSILITPQGELKVIYRKIHLFDVQVDGREVQESLSFEAGEQPAVVEICGWKLGLAICYDLRFSELFVHYHRKNVDLVLVPSSFLVPTGRVHWSTLLKARAIETQAFVAAPAQVGIHKSHTNSALPERQTWGESLVFGPWGESLGRLVSFDQQNSSRGESPLWVELDKSLIQKTRSQIPLLSHRKLHLSSI